MSEETTAKRQRSPINAVKILNQLRDEKGLPRVGARAKTPRITPELKKEITRQEIVRLYPEALKETDYVFNAEQAERLRKDVEFRLKRIKTGKEPAPEVESAPGPRRGRPRSKN